MGENYFSPVNIGNRAASYAVNGGSLLGNTSTATSAAPFKIDFLSSTASNATQKIADNASSGLDWFGNNGVIGSIGTGINALANAWNAYSSFTQGKQQLELMEKANDLAEKQYKTETQRYNQQKAEYDAATKAQQDTTSAIYSQFASNYQTPEQKKSVVERD